MQKSKSSQGDASALSNFKYEICLPCNCIFLRHIGSVTPNQVMDRQIHIMNQPEHQINMNRLDDLRGCRSSFGANDISEIADRLHQNIEVVGSFKQAVLLDDSLEHGTLRVLVSTMSDFTITYKTFLGNEPNFKTKIYDWLDIPNSYRMPNFIAL